MARKNKLFHPDNRRINKDTMEYYARIEIYMTCIHFVAGITFVVGSFMFLSEELTTLGTYFFIVGSFCFALAPSIRLWHEVRLVKKGEIGRLAERLDEEIAHLAAELNIENDDLDEETEQDMRELNIAVAQLEKALKERAKRNSKKSQ